jgi:oligosaccharide repeat unit polymerase
MTRPQARIWWLNPGLVMTLMLLPFATAAYLIPADDYVINWKTTRFFDMDDLILCGVCVGTFLLGGLLSALIFRKRKQLPEWGQLEPKQVDLLWFMFKWGVFLVFAAYIIWVSLAFHNGLTLGLLKEQFLGGGDDGNSASEIRNLMSTVPGITTATQFAPAVFIVGCVLYFNGRKKQVIWWMVSLILLTLLRSVAYSEREALTELAIPCVVLSAFYGRKRFRFILTGFVSVLWPVIAVGLVYLLFTGTEYLRSWKAHEDNGNYATVWSYSRDRLLAYYVVALNNGALRYHVMGQNQYPQETFDWLWRFPVVGSRALSMMSLNGDFTYADVLKTDANPEFNNDSGVLGYTWDWGEPGIYIFFFIAGTLVYAAYFAFCRGTPTGLFLYPFLFVGITEIARVGYWTNARTFPSWAFLFGVLFLLGRLKRQQKLRRREENLLFHGSKQLAAGQIVPETGFSDISATHAAPTRK